MKSSKILLIGIIFLLLLIINNNKSKSFLPSRGGVTIDFTGFGNNVSDATLSPVLYNKDSPYEMNSNEPYNLYYIPGSGTGGTGKSYYIADSVTTSELNYCYQPPCTYQLYASYENKQTIPQIDNISTGDVLIGTDLTGLTSYVINTVTTGPSYIIDSSNIIHINSSGTELLQIPFTHNIIDGAGIIKDYQKYNIMKIQLPSSTSASQTWLGKVTIGVLGQKPKFDTLDWPTGESIYIFPWDTGFNPKSPNISILLKEKTNYGKDGLTGDGSSFINDAYSKGYRTCNIIETRGKYCPLNANYRWGAQIQCTQPGLPTITSDYITESECLY